MPTKAVVVAALGVIARYIRLTTSPTGLLPLAQRLAKDRGGVRHKTGRGESVTQHMADKADLWARMTKKHGLRKFAFNRLVAYSEAIFERLLRRFRKERIVL